MQTVFRTRNARVEGRIHTLKAALGTRFGQAIPDDSCILPLMVGHAGSRLKLFEIWRATRSQPPRPRGRKMHPSLVDSGEAIQCMTLDVHNEGKLTARTCDGYYPGVGLTTGEAIAGNNDGVIKQRSIHRRPIDERWTTDAILELRGPP